MTFEEFFKKKRIDLAALLIAEPSLFSDFNAHFEQMGEKSFDHTKKYWFNKVRRQFPLAPEIKTEKVHIQNPLAEQTITESLIDIIPAATPGSAKLGFAPKFKTGNRFNPDVNSTDTKETMPLNAYETLSDKLTENTFEDPQKVEPKPAYKSRFKMQQIKPKTDTE